jgi:hypothetical protein
MKMKRGKAIVNFHLATRRLNRQESNRLTEKKNMFLVHFECCRRERAVNYCDVRAFC